MFETVLLSNIYLKPCCGYELKQRMKQLNPNNNKIYPTLKKLLDKGYINVELEINIDKPSRKIYSITASGILYFKMLLSDYTEKIACIPDEFFMRVPFFNILDRNTVLDILNKREKSLMETKSYTLDLIYSNEINMDADFSDIIDFNKNRTAEELKFIEKLRNKYK